MSYNKNGCINHDELANDPEVLKRDVASRRYRVYMHVSEDVGIEFDHELLRRSQQFSHDENYDVKRECDLWASPFADRYASVWEDFWYYDTKDCAKTAVEEWIESNLPPICDKRKEFINFLESHHSMGENEFYKKGNMSRYKLLSDYYCAVSKATLQDWESQYREEERMKSQWVMHADKIKQRALELLREDYSNVRNNSFWFVVDPNKILHIYDMNDITPFLTWVEDEKRDKIMFDKIQAAGYDGMELHNADALRKRNGKQTVFWSWDVDSISIWNPDCIIPIDKEIAYIIRIASETRNRFDECDMAMSADYLSQWISENKDKVSWAMSANIISAEDITQVISKRRVPNTDDYYFEKFVSEKIDRMSQDFNDESRCKITPRSLIGGNTLEDELAVYCVENDLLPVLINDAVIGKMKNDGTFATISTEHAKQMHKISIIAEAQDMSSGQRIAMDRDKGKVLLDVYGTIDLTATKDNIFIEANNNGKKIFLSTINFAEKYQELAQAYDKAREASGVNFDYDDRTDFDLSQTCGISNAPEFIVDEAKMQQDIKNALAARCVFGNKTPICGNDGFAVIAYDPSTPTCEQLFFDYEMIPGLILKFNDKDIGVIKDVSIEEYASVIETDEYLVARGIDFIKEYNEIIQSQRQSNSISNQWHDGVEAISDGVIQEDYEKMEIGG